MTTQALIALRKLAEAATPGEWVAKKWTSEEGETYGWNFAVNGYRLPLCEMETDNPNECDANAAYIAAANPDKVIALLDALEAQGREVAELKDRLESSVHGQNQTFDLCKMLEAERDTLRAELEAIRAQEPVAYRSLLPSGSYTFCNTAQFFGNAEPVYAAPAAKDAGLVADGWKLVPVEPTS